MKKVTLKEIFKKMEIANEMLQKVKGAKFSLWFNWGTDSYEKFETYKEFCSYLKKEWTDAFANEVLSLEFEDDENKWIWRRVAVVRGAFSTDIYPIQFELGGGKNGN